MCKLAILSVVLMGVVMAVAAESKDKDDLVAEASVRKVAGELKFIEGPVWTNDDGGYLVFSDIPADELKKWTRDGGVTMFRKPSHNTNGNTRDREGRLVSCEHTSRRVTRTEKDGTVNVLAERFEEKKLNSPNDLVVKSDGSIWFTDPTYGISKAQQELTGQFVYRLDAETRELKPVVKDFDQPNGLCFSPDEKRLYIADSGKSHHIRVFDVASDGTLENGRVFCVIDKGVPDGIRCDERGNIWSSAGDGVQVFSPEGALLKRIAVAESPANLCFGEADGKTVFMTARTSLYAIKTKVAGAKRP
jgi:gluconolactonase